MGNMGLNTKSIDDNEVAAILGLLSSKLSLDYYGSCLEAQKRNRRSIQSTRFVKRIKHEPEPFKKTDVASEIVPFLDLDIGGSNFYKTSGKNWEISSESIEDSDIGETTDVLLLPFRPDIVEFCKENQLFDAYTFAKIALSEALKGLDVVSILDPHGSRVKYPDEGDEKIVFRAIVDNSIDAALEAERMFYREFYQRVSVPQRFYFVFNCTPL